MVSPIPVLLAVHISLCAATGFEGPGNHTLWDDVDVDEGLSLLQTKSDMYEVAETHLQESGDGIKGSDNEQESRLTNQSASPGSLVRLAHDRHDHGLVFHAGVWGKGKKDVGDVDFVYCWAGEGCGGQTDHDKGCDNGELRASLRSIKMFAPWHHKVFVLVNSDVQVPTWAGAADIPSSVEFVDRCKLFDNAEDCPTFNSAACESLYGRIPSISEHMIHMDDDFFFIADVEKSDFFSPSGQPIVPNKEERVPVYSYPINYAVKDAPEQIPTRINWLFHSPLGLTKTFLLKFEADYSQWFSFVRSHTTRYEGGGSSLDEVFRRIWTAQLLDYGMAQTSDKFADGFCEFNADNENNNGLTCIRNKLGEAKFVNTNNVGSEAVWAQVDALLLGAGQDPSDTSQSEGADFLLLAPAGPVGATRPSLEELRIARELFNTLF